MCVYINSYCFISLAGVLPKSQSPQMVAPLESCRIAPNVILPTLRNPFKSGSAVNIKKNMTYCDNQQNVINSTNFTESVATAAAFTTFNPSIISAAAQQV